MKPQGNRVGIWTDRNARSQRTIGTEEEAKAEPLGGLLLDMAGRPQSCEARKPISGKIYKPKKRLGKEAVQAMKNHGWKTK